MAHLKGIQSFLYTYHRCSIKFVSILCVIFLTGCLPTQTSRTAQHVKPEGAPTRTQSYYAGYSKKYAPYRDKLSSGEVDAVIQMIDDDEDAIRATVKTDDEVMDKLRLVDLMERACLSLQAGDPERALSYCRCGQEIIEDRESESYFKEGASSIGSFFAEVSGAGEFGRYDAPGYEKVLLLDFASMAYLLQGDDRAFNVARLAIQWQDEEKERFRKELEKVVSKEKEKQKKDKVETLRSRERLVAALDHEFSKYDDIALEVPNAFVNPFGDYVTGMINEFKSVKLKSLISNAQIAYEQALKLNPESEVLKNAVEDTKKRKSADRLIHVVALDGFVPEKKVLSIPLDRDLEVELPVYNPIESNVSKIIVTTPNGTALATLSPVANVEALALRHQKDSLPAIQAMLVAATLRDAALVIGLDSLYAGLGRLTKKIFDKAMEPDTTSWMSLPSNILAARFYSPGGLQKLKIQSFDNRGKKLSEQMVTLDEGDRHFVLVRSMNRTMCAHPSKRIWSQRDQQ